MRRPTRVKGVFGFETGEAWRSDRTEGESLGALGGIHMDLDRFRQICDDGRARNSCCVLEQVLPRPWGSSRKGGDLRQWWT